MPGKQTPHLNKILKAMENSKCSPEDLELLKQIETRYRAWVRELNLVEEAEDPIARVTRQVEQLNSYKYFVEVEMVAQQGSSWLKRQKGQLKLDNSIIEEFLIYLVHSAALPDFDRLDEVVTGPQKAFMSMSFRAESLETLLDSPEVVLKAKDQDFTLGTRLHYAIGTDPSLADAETGDFFLAVMAAECKVNLDKTMYQEAAGTAGRVKQGCPTARYFVIAEWLDMTPEDPRLTDIDNVFLLRDARRLGPSDRGNPDEVAAYHEAHPIRAEVVLRIFDEIRGFVDGVWFDPSTALDRGSFL